MRTKFSLFLISLLLLVSCTNLDDVYRRLDDHDARLKKLETLTKDANKAIESLKQLVEAQAKRISIVSYNPLPNGEGYKLVMSDGSEIILKHGTDGKTPAIGIKEENGVLYWTLDGELMRDADGNPIPAKGQDGNDGITPQLRVNADGYWEVSLDRGKSWELVKDENGNPVQAVGKDGDSKLTITDNGDGTITIVFNGQTFVIPIAENPAPGERPRLAIEYMAEYDIDASGKAFANTHANDAVKLFTYQEAIADFGSGFAVGGKTYHIPNIAEWHGIIPKLDARIQFSSAVSHNNVSEEIEIAGQTATYTADYRCSGNNIGYALRFKDEGTNEQRTAWRYEYAENPASLGEKILKITVRYIGNNPAITVDQIAQEDYWNKSNNHDITRYLPAGGYMRGGEVNGRGNYGRYMSQSLDGSGNVYGAMFNRLNAVSAMAYYATDGFSLRLFETEADSPADQPKLAIEYVAEYNLQKDGNGFLTTHDNLINSNNLIHWLDALEYFKAPNYTRVIDGVTYQLPTTKQMASIFPTNKAVCFNFAKKVLDQQETVEVAGIEITSKNDYESIEVKEKEFIVYAHRYKNTPQESAWRYSLTNYSDPINRTMTVAVQPINVGSGVTIDQIKDEAFWAENSSKKVIKRVFPAAGSWYHTNSEPDAVGDGGYYRTRELSNEENPLIITIDGFGVEVATYMSQAYEVSLRPMIVPDKK